MPRVPEQNPLQLARFALLDADYDAALRAAAAIPTSEDRALMLLQIAYVSADPAIAKSALQILPGIARERSGKLERANRAVSAFLRDARGLTGSEPAAVDVQEAGTPLVIDDWLQWLEFAVLHPYDAATSQHLQHVLIVADLRFWTPQGVRDLDDYLLTVISTHELFASPAIKTALGHLADMFLQDTAFPRSDGAYADLYELLYMALVQRHAVSQSTSMQLLRFAEAMLRQAPKRRETLSKDVHDWFTEPIPAIKNSLFEAFELLGDYGLPGGMLSQLYRLWAAYILQLPTPRDRISLQTWLDFGEWIEPGADLMHAFRQALNRIIEESPYDPIAELPAGYRIAVFTLRPSSGERARAFLMGRNAKLDVRLCNDDVLTESAKALAQNSDLVVIVTTCLSHALTYGIGPYLPGDPVYPVLSGSTSIVRGIEDRLRATMCEVR